MFGHIFHPSRSVRASLTQVVATGSWSKRQLKCFETGFERFALQSRWNWTERVAQTYREPVGERIIVTWIAPISINEGRAVEDILFVIEKSFADSQWLMGCLTLYRRLLEDKQTIFFHMTLLTVEGNSKQRVFFLYILCCLVMRINFSRPSFFKKPYPPTANLVPFGAIRR